MAHADVLIYWSRVAEHCIACCLGRWKLVHGDVFRPPKYLELLAALVGTGVQLALLVLSVILITIAGALRVLATLPCVLP